MFSKQRELFEESSREKILISKMDASKKVKPKEADIPEWLKHECVWNVKAKAYKNSSARENGFRNLTELFEIIRNILRSQAFIQRVLRFLFCLVLLIFEIIAMAITLASSSTLIVLQLK